MGRESRREPGWHKPASAGRVSRHPDEEPRPRPRKRRIWPYVVVMLVVWAVIFGAIFWAHFLSDLPPVRNLLAAMPSRDITILDDRGRIVARRGLTREASVRVEDLPA